MFEDNKIKAIGCADADWVRKVFVSPESQGQGIGTNMLAYVEKQIRANGFDRSWAYSYPSSLDFALNRGYEIVERLTFKDRGLEIPGIKITKQLI